MLGGPARRQIPAGTLIVAEGDRIDGITAGKAFTPATIEVDNESCAFEPHVSIGHVGGKVAAKNSDPVLHNINAKPQQQRGFNISQPKQGMTTKRTFNQREVMVRVECDVHGWMSAYVGVLDNPYFATTGDQGGFTIEAWHERYGTQTQQVTVGQGETKTVEFTFNVAA